MAALVQQRGRAGRSKVSMPQKGGRTQAQMIVTTGIAGNESGELASTEGNGEQRKPESSQRGRKPPRSGLVQRLFLVPIGALTV